MNTAVLVEKEFSKIVDVPGVENIHQYRLSSSVFEIELAQANKNNVYFDYSDRTHSGVIYILQFARKPGFFLISYLIPALLIIFLTYAGFWLDKAAIPARVSIGITPILITANLIARANANVPSLSYTTWQSMFFLGILIFTAFGMIEYGILNF